MKHYGKTVGVYTTKSYLFGLIKIRIKVGEFEKPPENGVKEYWMKLPRFYLDSVKDIQREKHVSGIYKDGCPVPLSKSEEVTLTIKLKSSGNTSTWTNEDIEKWIENKINEQ